jgi:ribosome-associated heat shock protein Hsp15
MEQQRLDKWLWCARFYKTRKLAGDAIKSGRITVNDLRAKPARSIHTGDNIILRRPPYEYRITAIGFEKQRVAASGVARLYVELEDSRLKREALAQSIQASAIVEDRHSGKLSKKDRRERDKMKRSL